MLTNYKRILGVVIIPAVLAILTFILNYKPDLSILDNNNLSIGIGSDLDSGGNSNVKLLENQRGIYSYKFKLGESYEYPYVYFKVESRDSKYLDFTDYDKIKINISCSGSDFININFYRYIENYTKMNNFFTYFPYTYRLSLNEKAVDYIINTNQIYTPNWWIIENSFNKKEIPVRELKDILYFEIANSDGTPLDTEIVVTINSIQFLKSKTQATVSAILSLAIYFVFLVSVFQIFKSKREENRDLKLSTKKNIPSGKVENYIWGNYSDPLLNLTKISDDLGMSIKRVSEEINRRHGVTFPTFLNQVRVGEARKLLNETDMKILDIAITIGYNSPGHFNRIFKKMENCTPREYRGRKS